MVNNFSYIVNHLNTTYMSMKKVLAYYYKYTCTIAIVQCQLHYANRFNRSAWYWTN